jgi:S-methylmethionine-dependent homocysteine/selenocysteine methylase
MSKYRNRLPQLNGGVYLTDGGMETTLIFQDGMDLPHFASFNLIRSAAGRQRVRDYFKRYADIALRGGFGFVLESPTWRANADWGAKLGLTAKDLHEANMNCIELLSDLRDSLETPRSPMPISGNIGPRGDGYKAGDLMSVQAARDYHAVQIATLCESRADYVSAFTMNNVAEAKGVALAAQDAGIDCVISFTVETDGRLPSGDALGDAIAAVDEACQRAPVYYMINCAHPSHFETVLDAGEAWLPRLRGLRANSSRCSHEELDNATELDSGNPIELGREYGDLLQRYPHINVLGGCCGTDHRHVEEIARQCRLAA